MLTQGALTPEDFASSAIEDAKPEVRSEDQFLAFISSLINLGSGSTDFEGSLLIKSLTCLPHRSR